MKYKCSSCGHKADLKKGDTLIITGDADRSIQVACAECGHDTPIDS
jgi:DNA-directed RNA polymerase subunit RPC12/RpoP